MQTTRTPRSARPAKVLGTLAAVTMVGVLGFVGTSAALSDTTDNALNEFDAGAIHLDDNDAGSFMYDVEEQEPGDFVERCIQISYTGNLDSDVVLYMGTPIGSLGPYVDMTVEVGTQSSVTFPDCTGFASDSTLFTGTLADFQADHGTAGSGLAYSPNGSDPWSPGDAVVYKVRLELSATPRAVGEDYSLPHTYTWQATSV